MALPIVPSEVRVRAVSARTHFDEVGACAYCEMLQEELADGRRIILESEHFVAFSPYAASTPFHVWIVPKQHSASLLHATPAALEDLGRSLHFILRSLYVGLNNPDFNYVLRSAPVRDLGAPYLHWYITIVPRISLAAGFELGSGIYINPSLPEECADYLRTVDSSSLHGAHAYGAD